MFKKASKMSQWVKALVTCLNLVSIAETNHHDQKQLSEERIYWSYMSVSQSFIKYRWGQKEVGTETEAMEECDVVTCSLWPSQWLTYTSQDHLPRGGTTPH